MCCLRWLESVKVPVEVICVGCLRWFGWNWYLRGCGLILVLWWRCCCWLGAGAPLLEHRRKLYAQGLRWWLRDFGWVDGFGWRFEARLHLPVARDASLIFCVASIGSFSSLEHNGRQMLRPASQRLASLEHEGGKNYTKVETKVSGCERE
jgi:hypothetical protein